VVFTHVKEKKMKGRNKNKGKGKRVKNLEPIIEEDDEEKYGYIPKRRIHDSINFQNR
jgi:hypothetical protein